MTDIEQWYCEYNFTYFSRKLPRNCRIVYKSLKKVSRIGQLRRDKDGYIIEICTRCREWPRIARFTLLHEMAHLSVDLKRPGRKPHGHYWQREMKRLANIGAFAGLW